MEANPLPVPRSVDLFREQLEQLERMIEDCAVLAEGTKNDSVRLGAIKARQVAQAQRLELLRITGLLPRDLGRLGREIEYESITPTIQRVLLDHHAPRELVRDLVEALKDPKRQGQFEEDDIDLEFLAELEAEEVI